MRASRNGRLLAGQEANGFIVAINLIPGSGPDARDLVSLHSNLGFGSDDAA